MVPLLLLIASLCPLLLAPVLSQWLFRRSAALSFALDSFIVLGVSWMLILHVLPEALEHAGWIVLLAVGLGLLLPVGLHLERWRRGVLVLALAGLAVHALFDGVALALAAPGVGPHTDGTAWLAMAVLLHRLPMALAIWWWGRPALGQRWAIFVLVIIGTATVLGFLLGGSRWHAMSHVELGLLQGLLVGMLLHVLVGHSGPVVQGWRPALFAGLGGLFAATLLISVLLANDHAHGDEGETSWLSSAVVLVLLLALQLWKQARGQRRLVSEGGAGPGDQLSDGRLS